MGDRDDIYVQVLKMAREDLKENRPISLSDFIQRIPHLTDKHKIFVDIYGPILGQGSVHFMTLDAYMKLIDHEELSHSLSESKQARKDARIAILIAAGAIIVQVGLWIIDKFFPFGQSC